MASHSLRFHGQRSRPPVAGAGPGPIARAGTGAGASNNNNPIPELANIGNHIFPYTASSSANGGRRAAAAAPQYEMVGFLFLSNAGSEGITNYLASFNPARNSPNPLPYQVPFILSFRASSGGLLLGHPPDSPAGPYFVINPFTGHHARLLPPNSPHPPITPMALVADTAFIHVICLVPSRSAGFYRLDSFSCGSERWFSKPIHIFLGNIDAYSGICCGNAAYFRTISPAPSVIKIGPLPRLDITEMYLPMTAIGWMPPDHHLQLGSVRGELVLISSYDVGLRIHMFLPEIESWVRVDDASAAPVGWTSGLVPLRFESSRLEIPFWSLNQRGPMIFEEMTQRSGFRNVASFVRRMEARVVPFDFAGPQPRSVLDCVPYAIIRPSADMGLALDSARVATRRGGGGGGYHPFV